MIDNKKVVALVPIKDHSERVTGKNFRDFHGKPLYHHVVATLDAVDAVDEIVSDTDSPRVMEEIASLSPKARAIERPVAIRGDFVSMNRVLEHDLSQTDGDIYLQTHATNPLLRAETVAAALAAFVADEAHDSLFSVNQHQSRFYREDGSPVNHDPENLLRTQDLPPLFEENSSIYIFTKASFAQSAARIGKAPMMLPIPQVESTDIDDEFTFQLAEALAGHAIGREGGR